jgi:thioesterase domain-containing protein
LRYLVSGGEALDAPLAGEVRRALPHLRFGNFYGPTEAGVDATCYEITGTPDPSISVPIGRPIANARCLILDPWQNLAPIGVAGELHVGGLGLAHGYVNLPEKSTLSFIADPFAPGERLYRTGDFARYLPTGEIEYLGRIDAQVKLRGYRIEIAEVEGSLLQHPEIRQAAVVLREDTPGEPQLVAYVVLAPDATVTETEIRTLMRRALPIYMVPSAFCFLDALPLTASAKLDRSALPAPVASLPLGVASLLLEDPLERSLQEIWERTLGVRPIGPDDDFFALGGHSLKAIRLLADVQRVHGIELRAPVLFDAPTIRTLAVRMRDARLREVTSVIPVQPRGARTPLFFAPGAGGELFVFDELARALGPQQPLHVLDMYVFDEGEERTHELTLMDVAARMLRDIRQVQPHGPYQLAGYSLGGNIVLEIAQQMHAAGEQVALLALLDCDGPAYPLLQPFLMRTVQHIRHAVSLGPGKTLPYLWTRFGKLSRYINGPIEEELNLYRDQDEGQLVPRDVLDALEKSLAPVLKAWERYVPQFYAGAALVVRADVRLGMVGVVDEDPALGWGPIIGGGLKLERLDCNHFQLLRPEFARRLAALLNRYLARQDASTNGNSTHRERPTAIAG